MNASISWTVCLDRDCAIGRRTTRASRSSALASSTKEEQDLLSLSKDKWRWMAERNVDEPLCR